LPSTGIRAAAPGHEHVQRAHAQPPEIFALAGVAAVLCASLLLKIALATGSLGSDDVSYFRGASEILQQGWIPQVHHHLGRKVYILLAGIPAALGGKIMYGALVNIFYVGLLDLAVTAFVYREFGAMPALVAAIVTSLNGPELLWSGTLMPDMMVSLFMFLSTVALYYALQPTAEFPIRLLVASGALAGLSYAAKEPGILLLPPAAICILVLRAEGTVTRRVVWAAIYFSAFLCTFAAEGLLQLLLSGDFFYREHAMQTVANNSANPPVSLLEFARRVYWSLADIGTRYRDILLLPMIGGVISWIVVIFKRPHASVFAVTGLFVAGYLIFGSSSFPELRPLPFQPRYLAPLFPMMAVCLAAVLPRNGFPNRGAALACSIALLVFVAASLSGVLSEAGDLGRSRFFKNAAAALESELARDSDVPIMVDPNTLEVLINFMPQADYARLKPIPTTQDLPDGFYLVDLFPPDFRLSDMLPANATIRPHDTPHLQEILNLPIAATFNLNPLLFSRYFPDFGSATLNSDPLFVAVLRRKGSGP
jgi:hypothetical protein